MVAEHVQQYIDVNYNLKKGMDLVFLAVLLA